MALLFFAGAMVFSYPFVVDTINNFYDQRVIDNYQIQYQTAHKAQQKKQLAQMKAENESLLKQEHTTNIPGMGLVEDPFESALKNNVKPSKAYLQSHMIGAILFLLSMLVYLFLMKLTTSY